MKRRPTGRALPFNALSAAFFARRLPCLFLESESACWPGSFLFKEKTRLDYTLNESG
jgi:hypothetical protein